MYISLDQGPGNLNFSLTGPWKFTFLFNRALEIYSSIEKALEDEISIEQCPGNLNSIEQGPGN